MKNISEKAFINVVANVIICLLVVVVFSLSFAGDIITPSNTEEEKAIYRGNPANKNVSLMFNVYEGTEYLDGILASLEKYDAVATFFVGGIWVSKNTDVLKKIYEAGHEIGNHGYLHRDHLKLSLLQNKEEITLCHRLVESAVGLQMTLFAPPSGAFNSVTLAAAHNLNYKTVMWSKDTIDWRDQDSGLIYSRATKNTSNGDLILCHLTSATSRTLENILHFFKKNGFKVVTVSQNIALG